MVATHNPFRTPGVTPTPTGASTTSSSSAAAATSNNDARTRASSDSVNDLLTEELPPAYTPAPNVYEGEATLEVGPRRPFQQPVAAPPQHPAQFPPPSWGIPTQHTSTGPWSSFPGHYHRERTGNQYLPPPPVHPQSARPSTAPNSPAGHASDFVRDFYAAGGGDGGLYGGASAQYSSGSPGTSSSSSMGRFAPPPGEPSRKNAPTSPTSPTSDGVPDDGRPTERPVPGHPLLRHGKVLVYPNGFECQKCRNTGYRNFDPSHPCSRCWDKYAKPYSGPITYAPWSADGSSSSSSSSSFQRPLPTFHAPQSSLHQQSASWSGPFAGDQGLGRSATMSRASNGYPGASAARVIPIAGGVLPVSPYLGGGGPGPGPGPGAYFPPPSWGSPGLLHNGGPPAAGGGVAVYPPGDPRIGGRLCWRCGGKGKTSFLIFDEETCGICNGVGRTFM